MFEIFESVEDVWIIWAVSVTLFAFCVRHAMKRFSWKSVRGFARSEEGASYALPFVLSFPIYLLLMAVLLQASLILMCKIGTVYAAYGTARTITVWQGHEPENSDDVDWGTHYLRYKAKRTATMAMVPFANSYKIAREDLFPLYPISVDVSSLEAIKKGAIDLPETFANLLAYVDRELYAEVYGRLNEDAHSLEEVETSEIIQNQQSQVSDDYIRNKYAFAAAATKVTFSTDRVAWNEDLTVTVRYRMAFHVPGTARIFGGESSFWADNLYRDIETTVTIPSEAAQTDDGTIGIPHNMWYLKIL
jgi:hypothetical protein